MLIANPIYDVVFRYLLKDSRIAKLLIGAIIETEIISLDPRPTEQPVDHPRSRRPIETVNRLDFSARILTDEGPKTIIIEIRKAKFASDIMRFRRYLGDHYRDELKVCDNAYSYAHEPIEEALPIITIYFLGHTLDTISAPVIKVKRSYIDSSTGEVINAKDPFIESLTHDSYIIQIPCLPKKFRTELECLLSVFDQSNRDWGGHILNIDDEDFPEKFRPIIRRLQKAMAKHAVRDRMTDEDEIIEDILSETRRADRAEMERDSEKAQNTEKDEIIKDQRKEIEILKNLMEKGR